MESSLSKDSSASARLLTNEQLGLDLRANRSTREGLKVQHPNTARQQTGLAYRTIQPLSTQPPTLFAGLCPLAKQAHSAQRDTRTIRVPSTKKKNNTKAPPCLTRSS